MAAIRFWLRKFSRVVRFGGAPNASASMSVRIIPRFDRCESREPTNTMLLGTLFGAGFSWPLADFTPPGQYAP